MDGMISVAEVIDRIAGTRHENLSDSDKIEVDDVLEAAAAWAAGQLPIHEFAKVGTIPSPYTGNPSGSYTRYVAMLSTPVTDARRHDLRRALDALLTFQGFIVTSQGVFAPADIADIPVAIRREREAAA